MKGVAARVAEAIVKLQMDDTENAMLQTASAIDGTARKRFGTKIGNRARFTRFLEEDEDFLIYGMMAFTTHLYVKGRLDFSSLGTVPELIYSSVRNPLIHEGEISPKTVFINKEKEIQFGFRNEKLLIAPHLVLAMLLKVIGDSANADLSFDQPWMLTVNENNLSLNHLWGQFDLVKRQVGFENRPPELVV